MSDELPPDGMYSGAAARIAALRRVSGPEIVDEGIQLARQNYGALVLAALVPQLACFGADLWTYSSGDPDTVLSTVILFTVWIVSASLADAAAARASMDALEGRAPDPVRALQIALRRSWPIVLAGVYRAIFALLGLALLLIPGLYILTVYALIPGLPVLEPGISGRQALRRSAELTKDARRLAFGAYVAPYAFAGGASMVVSTLMEQLAGPHVGKLFGDLLGCGIDLAATPFIAAIQVRLYVELRMRKEAIDIEWALAAESPGTAVAS